MAGSSMKKGHAKFPKKNMEHDTKRPHQPQKCKQKGAWASIILVGQGSDKR
jgi:hypothetical protein